VACHASNTRLYRGRDSVLATSAAISAGISPTYPLHWVLGSCAADWAMRNVSACSLAVR
jgi:hypothetical protein